MSVIRTHSIVQTAAVTRSRAESVARVADLFAAVPIDLKRGPDAGKVDATAFAFHRSSNLEALDPLAEGHTRHRFLRRNGPGACMLSCALLNDDAKEVGESLRADGVRVAIEGPFGIKRRHIALGCC